MAEMFFREKLEAHLQDHEEYLYSGGRYGSKLVLDGADLTGIDLSELNLTQVSFRNANLSGVDLSGSLMYGCDFSGANLSGASLEGSSVVRARFMDADLSDVFLEGCDARGADFSGAKLWSTDLEAANIEDAILDDIDEEPAIAQSKANAYVYDTTPGNVKEKRVDDVPLVINDENAMDVLERIKGEVDKLQTSEQWKDYLKTMKSFRNYSFFNCNLISLQRDNAVFVAGYNTWKKLGRHVIKGERALKIVLPIFQKRDVEKELPDGSIEKTEEQYIAGWQVKACVFDYSQTQGRPLNLDPTSILTEDLSNYNQVFRSLVAAAPCKVSIEDFDRDANGYYASNKKRIAVRQGLPELQTVKTLTHEMVHAEHDLSGEFEGFSRAEREMLAESTAWLVMEHFGLDTSDYSIPYVAAWSQNLSVGDLSKVMSGVTKFRDQIIEKVEYYMTHDKERTAAARRNLVRPKTKTETKARTATRAKSSAKQSRGEER